MFTFPPRNKDGAHLLTVMLLLKITSFTPTPTPEKHAPCSDIFG